MPASITDRDIWALFGPFGAVTNVEISQDQMSVYMRKKMATVIMPIYDEAIFAIMALNDKPRMVSFLNFMKFFLIELHKVIEFLS